MAGSQSLQAHDGIPREILRDANFAKMFADYLPGWKVNGEYNYRISASTQKAAVQLEQIMHSGSHPWINERLKELMADFNDFPEAEKPKRLAQLVNFIHESQSLGNLSAAGKTNGYVAFTSNSDPYWLDFQSKNPQYATLHDYHNQ